MTPTPCLTWNFCANFKTLNHLLVAILLLCTKLRLHLEEEIVFYITFNNHCYYQFQHLRFLNSYSDKFYILVLTIHNFCTNLQIIETSLSVTKRVCSRKRMLRFEYEATIGAKTDETPLKFNEMHSGRSPYLGIWMYFEPNYAYGNIHYVRIPKSGNRPECIAFTKTSIILFSDQMRTINFALLMNDHLQIGIDWCIENLKFILWTLFFNYYFLCKIFYMV